MFGGTVELNRDIRNINVLAGFLLINPDSLNLVKGYLFSPVIENHMFMQHLEFPVHGSVTSRNEIGKADGSLFFSQIPEVNRLSFILHSRPGVPKPVMVIMVRCLYPSQFFSSRRPKRMDE